MADIKINQKNGQSIGMAGYTQYFTNGTANNVGNMPMLENYLSNNALIQIQDIANKTISSDAAYWHEAYIKNFNMDNIDFSSNTLIANDGQFIVVMSLTEDSLRIFISTNGGFDWIARSLFLAFNNIQITSLEALNIKYTSAGYQIIFWGEDDEFNSYSYVIIFRYDLDSVSDIVTNAEDYLFRPFNSTPLPSSQCKIINTPIGFVSVQLNRDMYYHQYIYNYKMLNTALKNIQSTDDIGMYWKYLKTIYPNNPEYALQIDNVEYDKMIARICVPIKYNNLISIGLHNYTNYNADDIIPTNKSTIWQSTNGINGSVFYLFEDSVGFVCPEIYNGLIIYNIKYIPLPDNTSEWRCIFGNNHRVYVLSQDGKIAYIGHDANLYTNGNVTWHFSNQSADMTGQIYQPITSFAPISYSTYYSKSKFACSENGEDIVALLQCNTTPSTSTVKLLHTHTGNLR